MPKWVRDFLLLPAIVGLIVAAFTFGLPKIFSEKNELIYEIDGPTSYLKDPVVQNVEVSVNGRPVKDIVTYRIRIWNSGDKPIKELPFRIVFETKQPDFLIFSSSHNTKPQYEFGEISETESDKISKRYIYKLLNPADQDILTVLTNGAAQLAVFTKAEGLKVVQRQPGEGPFSWVKWPVIAAFAALASLLAELLKELLTLMRRRIRLFISGKKEND